jgi:hypothetical protein
MIAEIGLTGGPGGAVGVSGDPGVSASSEQAAAMISAAATAAYEGRMVWFSIFIHTVFGEPAHSTGRLNRSPVMSPREGREKPGTLRGLQ